jgi:pyruvate dehydrogenase E1 component alpha subunit
MGVVYRTDEEVLEWRKRDPIALFEAHLAEAGILSPDDAQKIHERTEFEVQQAIEFAKNSPFPADSDLLTDVYSIA